MLLAFRLAWNDLLAHKKRSVVAVVALALPVALLMFISGMFVAVAPETDDRSPTTRVTLASSACYDLATDCIPKSQLEKVQQTPDRGRIAQALGDEQQASGFFPEFQLRTEIIGDTDAIATVEAIDPRIHSNLENLPEAGEIILSEETSFVTNRSEGSQVTLRFHDETRTLTVIGVARETVIHVDDSPIDLPSPDELVSSTLADGVSAEWGSNDAIEHRKNDVGVTFDANTSAVVATVSLFGDLADSVNSIDDFFWLAAILGLALLLIACVAGPVFAVSARRKLATLGLLSSIGARPSDLRNIMLAEGVLVGCCGVVVGTFGTMFFNIVTAKLQHQSVTVSLPWDSIIVVVLVAILSGIAAALAPAFQAGALNPVEALAGGTSRRMQRLRPHHGIAPFITVIAGLGLVSGLDIVTPISLLVMAIGGLLSTHVLVFFAAAIGGKLPLSLRMATRDAARNYHRTVPAVAAVTGTMMLAFTYVSVALHHSDYRTDTLNRAIAIENSSGSRTAKPFNEAIDSLAAQYETNIRTDSYDPINTDTLETVGLSLVPPASAENLSPDMQFDTGFDHLADISTYYEHNVYVVDTNAPVLLAAIRPEISDEQAREAEEALRAGKVVVDSGLVLHDGQARIAVRSYDDFVLGKTTKEQQFDAVTLGGTRNVPPYFNAFISSETLKTLGLDSRYSGTRIARDRDFNWVEQLKIQLYDENFFSGHTAPVNVYQISDQTQGPIALVDMAVPLAIVVIFTLFIVFVVILLASAESRKESKAMRALGASETLIRLYGGAQGFVVGALGTVAGYAYGFFLLVGIFMERGDQLIDLPWATLTALCIAIPFLSWITGLIFGSKTTPGSMERSSA
ncbi:MAG: ABC transporter permease [Corynebacterium sp.]|nr:ABC transporter permease [Corynebacterium sp.]